MIYAIIGAGGAVALGTFVYGAFRRFLRMKWTPYQILLLFALTLLVSVIGKSMTGVVGFVMAAGILLAGAALVLIGSHFLRRFLINHRKPSFGLSLLDRIFGAFTAFLSVVLYLVILAASVLVVLQYVAPIPDLDFIYNNAIWVDFGQKYALDLLLVTLVLLAVRGGYRLGILCSLQTLLTIVFVFGAFFLSIYCAFNWSFLNGLIARLSASLGGSVGSIVGFLLAFFIVTLVFTFLLVAVFMVLNFFLCIPLKRIERGPVSSAIDGSIMAVISFAFVLVLVCGFDTGVFALAGGLLEGLGEFGEALAGVFVKIESAIRGSSLGGYLYDNNPVKALLG